MNFTKAMTDLFLSVKEWAQPAFDALSDRIDEREAAIRVDLKGQIDLLFAGMSEGIESRFLAIGYPEKISEQCLNDVRGYFDSKMEEIRATNSSIDHLQPAIDEAVVKAISAMPVPKDGQPGEPGKDGASIDMDAVADLIDKQVIKAISEIEIVAPQDGKPGRDALDIDLMPLIDEGKSYPRGTWATHNGGIWRAHSNTSGLRGWECVVDGICGHEVEQLDPRNYESVTRFSSGKETRRKMSLPNTVYREIYKAGEQYNKGDLVTWGGSLWYCCEDTDTKPGESPAWKLAAKKGRDGKS